MNDRILMYRVNRANRKGDPWTALFWLRWAIRRYDRFHPAWA